MDHLYIKAILENLVARSNYGNLNSLGLSHSLVLFWKANPEFDGVRGYYELEIEPKANHYIGCDDDEKSQLSCYATHSAGCTIKSSHLQCISEGVIARVFQKRLPEMSPNISYYSQDEYQNRDFALSCGILASFCFPLYKPYGILPYGVMEIVSTRNQEVGAVREFCESFKEFDWVSTFRSIDMPKYAVPEIEQLLEVVCQIFQLPLAQYWIETDSCNFFVAKQFSYGDFVNSAPWCHFKHACLQSPMDMLQGIFGEPYEFNQPCFCRDITKLSIANHPFIHYARDFGSIACFKICLLSPFSQHKDCVLEFFLPSLDIDHYPQTFLKSLFAKMKEHLTNYKLATGEQLGQVPSVKVIDYSSHKEPKSFRLVLPKSNNSLPHHEGAGHTPALNLFQNGTEQMSNSERIPNEVTQINHYAVDESEEELDVMCTRPHSLASQHKKSEEILKYKGTTEEIGHSERADELDKELPIKYNEPQSLTSQLWRPEEISGDEGYIVSSKRVPDEDVEYAVTTAPKGLKESEIPFTVENIRKYFGTPLEVAADNLGVSRSTFKRICRSVGIPRWPRGKRKLIDDETGKEDLSSSTRPLQDTPVVAHRSQELKNMTVKAAYNGITIKFELSSSSGLSELEDNVIKRLHLERNSFSIKYEDNDNELILIGCDEDVQEYMKFSRSVETTIKMLIHPPVNHYAP